MSSAVTAPTPFNGGFDLPRRLAKSNDFLRTPLAYSITISCQNKSRLVSAGRWRAKRSGNEKKLWYVSPLRDLLFVDLVFRRLQMRTSWCLLLILWRERAVRRLIGKAEYWLAKLNCDRVKVTHNL